METTTSLEDTFHFSHDLCSGDAAVCGTQHISEIIEVLNGIESGKKSF